MNRTLLVVLLMTVSFCAHAGNRQSRRTADTFDIQWIQDQHVLGVNRETGHATLIPYASRADLMADARFREPWLTPTRAMTLDLNGEWRFRYVPGSNQGPGQSEFYAEDCLDERWPLIRVPLSWEMAGYSKPTYNNTGYPFRNEPPCAMDGYEEHGVEGNNATGFYRRTFDLPAAWQDKRVFIHFDGVYSCAAVWVNGQFVGYGQGANNDAEYDITAAVRPGKNQLSVRVYRWCDGSYLEGQDMWRLSGIHRDVYLVAKPRTFIRDHVVSVPDQSADGTCGRLSVALDIDNRSGERTAKTFRLELIDAEGWVVARREQKVSLRGTDAQVTLTTPLLSNLIPWNAEAPYLYDIIVTQLDGKKEEMVFATKYGFRNIQLVNTEDARYVTINGRRVFFKGTNIHDTHPEYGRYVDVETMLRDVTLMKRANLNTVRTSHYPRQPKMYAIFDAFGLYVMDEADLECHGNQGLTRDTAWTGAFVDRDVRMVQRDRNHPSVIFWSLGNENGSGQNMDSCYAAVRRLDDRPIHCHGNETSTDMHSEMYTSVNGTRNNRNGWGGKPFFICEYAHAMGQAVGNLVDYWREIGNSSGIVGACIWDWVDQSIYDPVRLLRGDTIDAYGFHAWTGGYDYDSYVDDNPGRYNDHSFQGNYLNNGIITPDRAETAKLAEVKKVYQHVAFSDLDLSDCTFRLTNKYPFLNLGDRFYVKGTLARDGRPLQDFRIDDLNVPAGATAAIALPRLSPSVEAEGASEVTLTLALCLKEAQRWAPVGYALADEQFILRPRPAKLPPAGLTQASQPHIPLSVGKGRGGKTSTVSGQDFEVEFNEHGQLCSYVFHGRQLLAAVPEYNDFRRIDNDAEGKQYEKNTDDGGDHNYDYAATGILSYTTDSLPSLQGDGSAVLTMQATGWKTNYAVTYTIYPGGIVDMKVTFDPQRRGLRRLGLGFGFAPGFDEVEYYARGPWSNYKDRQTGSYLGRYKTAIDDLIDENIHPQTYGDRQDLRELTLSGSSPISLRIQTEGPVAFSLSHFNELEWNNRIQYERLHWSDLTYYPQTFAHFDLWQRGIGNNSCFSDSCLPHYETPYPGNSQGLDSLTYTLRFIPLLTTNALTPQLQTDLSRYDFFYAGESIRQQMFMVRGGRVTWHYSDPQGRGEISDAVLLTDGHILMAHQHGIREIAPIATSASEGEDYTVIWQKEAPRGYEIHSIQPIGQDKVVYIQCGNPMQAVVMEIPSLREIRRIDLPFSDGGSHGQMRNFRLTRRGTLLLAHMQFGFIMEFDHSGRELRRWPLPGAWGVEELANGHILACSNQSFVCEFDCQGAVVWDFNWRQQPRADDISPQKAHRLPNGNTLINNWFNEWGGKPVDRQNPPVQAIEVTPDGKVVWELRTWNPPADLGPSTTIQLLSEPVDRTQMHWGNDSDTLPHLRPGFN